VYFKGDSASLVSESPMSNTTSIVNLKKDYQRLLLDIPFLGKKYSVVFSPADMDMIAASMPDLEITPGTETKTIAGYQTTKHSVTEKKTSTNSEAWFTKDVEIAGNPLTQYFDASHGFPVQFTSYTNGMSINA